MALQSAVQSKASWLAPSFALEELFWAYWPWFVVLVALEVWLILWSLRARARQPRPVFLESLPILVWALAACHHLNIYLNGHFYAPREFVVFALTVVIATAFSFVLLCVLLAPAILIRWRSGTRPYLGLGQPAALFAVASVVFTWLLVLALVSSDYVIRHSSESVP